MAINPSQTLRLQPGTLHLDLYHGNDDAIAVYRRDPVTLAQLTLTGWTTARAVMRPARGLGTEVDLLPVINGDQIDIDITPAMKTALGSRGVWEVEILDPASRNVTLVQGTVIIATEVAA